MKPKRKTLYIVGRKEQEPVNKAELLEKTLINLRFQIRELGMTFLSLCDKLRIFEDMFKPKIKSEPSCMTVEAVSNDVLSALNKYKLS